MNDFQIALNVCKEHGWVNETYASMHEREQVMIPCPLQKWYHKEGKDTNASMSISVREGVVRFYCFGCRVHGPFWMLFSHLATLTGKEEHREAAKELERGLKPSLQKRLATASEKMWNTGSATPLNQEAFENWWNRIEPGENEHLVDYLLRRKIHKTMISIADIRLDRANYRLLVPSYGRDGRLEMVVGRELHMDADPPYFVYWKRNSSKYLGQVQSYCTDYPIKAVIVVEGCFDLLKTQANLMELEETDNYRVVCTYTSRCSCEQAGLLEVYQKPVYCMYDGDEAGDAGFDGRYNPVTNQLVETGMRERLKGRVPKVLRVRPEDNKDPGDMTAQQLADLLRQASKEK